MKLKQSKVFKAGIGYTIGNVMVKGINFLAIPIFSRLLTTEEMGLYTVFAAYEAVLFVFIGMALHSSIRSAKYEFEGKIDDFTSSIMGIYWINLIVALFISIVFNKILTKLLDLDLVTLVMLVIYSFGIAVVTLYNARISLDYEYKKYIKVSLASTIGNVGLSLILIKTIFNSSRGFGRVLGITISTVLVTVYIIYDLYIYEPRSFFASKKRCFHTFLDFIGSLISCTNSTCDICCSFTTAVSYISEWNS